MLVQRRNPAIRTYFVWGYYQGSDNEDRAREVTMKYAAPNSAHFWSPTQEISQGLVATLGLAPGRMPFDVYLLYRRGLLWESRLPLPTYWQQQIGLVQGDPFDISRLEARIQPLLGK